MLTCAPSDRRHWASQVSYFGFRFCFGGKDHGGHSFLYWSWLGLFTLLKRCEVIKRNKGRGYQLGSTAYPFEDRTIRIVNLIYASDSSNECIQMKLGY